MKVSRREWSALLPVLAAATAQAQSKELSVLPGKVYGAAEIPTSGNEKKRGGRIFYGSTHGGFKVESHTPHSSAPRLNTQRLYFIAEATKLPNHSCRAASLRFWLTAGPRSS